MNFFSKTRIQAKQLFFDAYQWLSQEYKQANEVFTPASPFGQILTVVSNLGELILGYIELVATELNLSTARNIESIYGLSRLTGHDPYRGIAAKGIISIRINSSNLGDIEGPYIKIKNNTKLEILDNNCDYFLNLNEDYIKLLTNNNSWHDVEIIQGEIEEQIFTGTGESLSSFNIITKQSTDHFGVKVYVNDRLWEQYDSLYDMNSTTEGFLCKTGVNGGLTLFFGTGSWGKVPEAGSRIRVTYIKHVGNIGNVTGKNLNFKFIDVGYDYTEQDVDLNSILSINVIHEPTLGSDNEDPNFTRLISPMASKSFVLANPKNYIYFLSKYNYFSFIDAYNTKDDSFIDDDNIIYLFLLPDIRKKLKQNEDYFNVPLEKFVLNQNEVAAVYKALSDSGQQLLTVEEFIIEPIIKQYAININVRYVDDFSKEEIRTEIRSQLNEYFLSNKRRDRIPRSDLVAIIEAIPGVDSVSVMFISKDNEEAIQRGYYNIQTQTKDSLTGITTYTGERKIFIKSGDDPNIGLDSFGDIKIEKNQFPVIRGGWLTRTGNYVEEYPTNGLSSLTINFTQSVNRANLNK